MSWSECTILDIADKVLSGGTPSSTREDYYDGDIPWLRTQEVNFNRINETEKYITQTGLDNSNAKWIKANSVIVAMYGNSAGRVAISRIILTTNQACCNIEVNPSVADADFIYYQLINCYPQLKGLSKGAAQSNLNASDVKGFPVQLPPLPTQQHIASILSAYDDLIENNLKRIKLLEEAAQNIFREWFVHFRFPGWKKVKWYMDDKGRELPAGWSYYRLEELYLTSSGGTPSRKNHAYYNGDINWFKTGELNDDFLLSSEEQITNQAIEESSAKLFPVNSVIMAMYGATIGKLGILSRIATTNQACCAIMPRKDVETSYFFVYEWLKENREHVLSFRMGAAQENISQNVIRNLLMLHPPAELIRQYHRIVNDMFGQRLSLKSQNTLLKEARDILLPRLMNRTIEV